ncbi:hypothetical protein GCM10025857_10080 [Alicyclobacillus contaminans]|uniref:5'-3' exonuclease n=1 Tax=Alicyclobacillus contaminans TaxID=392016 RepID=UPI00041918D8|nr:5'-3' exonuclease H3TH domain-containing protein [Alicyclobacillus contaminans]GMA49651.1 hypothetical protein GCM10025857_10080 [Alicyclobacillus contaminans]
MIPADFLIMDGSAMLVRAFFASAGGRWPRTQEGHPTNALFGFLNLMTGALQRVRPSHACVAWDVSRDTFRRTLYAAYKGTRAELPEDLHPQFSLMQKLLSDLGIAQVRHEAYEADDLMGTLAVRAAEAGLKVLILTGDHDALQLVGPDVTVAIMRRGITEVDLYTPTTLEERFGLTPAQWIDLKALMGDRSDNIPGVPGIGQKTALKLLSEHHTLQQLLAAAPSLPGAVGRRLCEHHESALLSQRLATIVTDVPIALSPADCRLTMDVDAAEATLTAWKLQRFVAPLRSLA